MCALPVDTYGHGSGCEELVSFPLPQGLVKRSVPRPAGGWSTRQSDWQPVEAVKVSAVLVDGTLEPVDGPVSAGLADTDGGTKRTPSLVQQAVLANLDLCNSVVGGPTSTFLSSADGIVALAGYVTTGALSPADLAGGVTL